jgi:integrase
MATVVIQKRRRQDRCSYPIYYRDPATGRRKYYKTFQRQKEAQQAANELRFLLDNGKIAEVKRTQKGMNLNSFEEVSESLMRVWKDRLEKSELSRSTYKGYSLRTDILQRVFGNKLLCEISRDEILSYRNKLAIETSNISSNRNLFVLKQIFKYGMELGAVKKDPTDGIKYLSEKEHERNEFLMPNELDRLIEACQQLRSKYYLPAIVYLGAEHGASKQEVLDLQWSDIIFSFQGKGLIRFFRTKNKMERSEFLMPRTREALLEWREHQEWMREKKNIEDIGPGYVFCRLDGRSLKGFASSWRKVRKIAGFEGLHFHDLRHTYCSNLLLSGSDLKDVKEMIGHRNLSMTDRYSHLTSMKKLSRQVELAKFYTNENGTTGPSVEHIWNTEGQNGVFDKKRAD